MNNRDVSLGGFSHNIFYRIVSLENLFCAWREFRRGKEQRYDVQEFAFNLEENIFKLHEDLFACAWEHGRYESFIVCDPKPRLIHKASVCDRVVHHAVMRILSPLADQYFIDDSFASRCEKGTHAALIRLRTMLWKMSRNNTKQVWILQCDVRAFFASVRHDYLIKILGSFIRDNKAVNLCMRIIKSFQPMCGIGLPLGNVTSQLFANSYLNKIDHIMKRIGTHCYVRYMDDIVIGCCDRQKLKRFIQIIKNLLGEIGLKLHPRKLSIRPWRQGIDTLGYVLFPHYTVLRTRTKRRMLRRITFKNAPSYFGMLKHCRGSKIARKLSDILNMSMKTNEFEKIDAEIPSDESEKNSIESVRSAKDKESREFVEEHWRQHGAFYQAYAGVHGFLVEPSPPKLGTFAVNLIESKIYIAADWFLKRGFPERSIPSFNMHEMEHVREVDDLIRKRNGIKIWREFLEKKEKSRRFGILNNCIDDIKVNRTEFMNAPAAVDDLIDFYKTRFNPDKEGRGSEDFTKAPRHLQFAYGLLRRAMLPEENIIVDGDVHEAIEELDGIKSSTSGRSVLDIMTDPSIGMDGRLRLQEEFVEPLYERLFKKDLEERKKGGKNKPEKPQDGEKGEGEATDEEEGSDDEKYFSDEYDAYDETNPDGAIDDKTMEDAVDEAEKSGAHMRPRLEKKSLDPAQNQTTAAYEKEHGVSAGDIAEYNEFYKQIVSILDLGGEQTVIDGLRELFERIISKRTKPQAVPKHPVLHGHRLSRPAEAHVSVRSGITHPPVWETIEKKERKGILFGDVDIILVCDRSESMAYGGGEKARQQRISAGLIMEALAEFEERLKKVRHDLIKGLTVRTGMWTFGGPSENLELKSLSDRLTEQDRVRIFRTLGSTPGKSTMDYEIIRKIADSIDDREIHNMRRGILKKVVIVLTDGESSYKNKLSQELIRLRGTGTVVIGVGITKSGASAKISYAPEGEISEKETDLLPVLAKLLAKHLADISTPRYH